MQDPGRRDLRAKAERSESLYRLVVARPFSVPAVMTMHQPG